MLFLRDFLKDETSWSKVVIWWLLVVVVGGEPRKVVRIGMPRKGKYMVREEIEKAPTHDHPCNLTR